MYGLPLLDRQILKLPCWMGVVLNLTRLTRKVAGKETSNGGGKQHSSFIQFFFLLLFPFLNAQKAIFP